jgi:hypothetical protein
MPLPVIAVGGALQFRTPRFVLPPADACCQRATSLLIALNRSDMPDRAIRRPSMLLLPLPLTSGLEAVCRQQLVQRVDDGRVRQIRRWISNLQPEPALQH